MAAQTKMSKKSGTKMVTMKVKTKIEKIERKEKKWVVNLSNTPLTEEQERLLAHGPKFVITPRETPVKEYIVAVEQACTKIEQGKQ